MNRADVESILVRRCRIPLEMASMDYQTISGVNLDLNDPIYTALKRLGYTVANATSVTDSEIDGVDDDLLPALLDIAELRTLETCQTAAVSLVDVTIGPRRESLSQFSQRLESLIERKRKQVAQDYGSYLGTGLEAGTFSVSSLEDGDNVY